MFLDCTDYGTGQIMQRIWFEFLSGAKNWGQVVNKDSEKSNYDPELAKNNFSMPDEKELMITEKH